MSSGFKLTCFCALPLLLSWACAPDLDSLSAEYVADAGGSAGSGNPGKGGSVNGGSSSNTSGTNGDSGAGSEPASCENLDRDSDESDVDCGGKSDCKRCRNGLRCSTNGDCASEFCDESRCAAPSCADGVKNQDETAVDCGGTCSPQNGCEAGVACEIDQDCKSEFCEDNMCADHCTSGVTEADETDKDCGGSCDQCDDNKRCLESSDCKSLLCSNNECQPATCGDKVLNQDESDKDCGGVCVGEDKACPLTARCNSGADCESYVCSKNKCIADIDVPAGDVIENFEDGDFVLLAQGGRAGNWYAYGDGTGTVTQEVKAIKRGPNSARVMYGTGANFTSWGSGIGVDLNNTGGSQAAKKVYDASAYTGVTFWARAETTLMVSVIFPDGNTDPAGAICTVCDHHWFKPVQFDTEWKRYTVTFDSLVLENGTEPVPVAFDATRLVSLQFRLASGQNYELWLDDIAFVK
jgi:hypothetical protein